MTLQSVTVVSCTLQTNCTLVVGGRLIKYACLSNYWPCSCKASKHNFDMINGTCYTADSGHMLTNAIEIMKGKWQIVSRHPAHNLLSASFANSPNFAMSSESGGDWNHVKSCMGHIW